MRIVPIHKLYLKFEKSSPFDKDHIIIIKQGFGKGIEKKMDITSYENNLNLIIYEFLKLGWDVERISKYGAVVLIKQCPLFEVIHDVTMLRGILPNEIIKELIYGDNWDEIWKEVSEVMNSNDIF